MVEVAAGPSDSATHEKVLYVVWKYGTNFQLLHFIFSKIQRPQSWNGDASLKRI